jgi:hypothetical protein
MSACLAGLASAYFTALKTPLWQAPYSIHTWLYESLAACFQILSCHDVQEACKRETVVRTLYDAQAKWADPLIQATGIEQIVSNYHSLSAIASVSPASSRGIICLPSVTTFPLQQHKERHVTFN